MSYVSISKFTRYEQFAIANFTKDSNKKVMNKNNEIVELKEGMNPAEFFFEKEIVCSFFERINKIKEVIMCVIIDRYNEFLVKKDKLNETQKALTYLTSLTCEYKLFGKRWCFVWNLQKCPGFIDYCFATENGLFISKRMKGEPWELSGIKCYQLGEDCDMQDVFSK